MMNGIPDKKRAKSVRDMFSRIAGRYDVTNRIMTWGQDVRWRREVIEQASLPATGWLLDIGTGTGDLALEAGAVNNALNVVGADFTPEMLRQGMRRKGGETILWVNTDGLGLPFPENTFDVVVSGYLMRNLVDIDEGLREQYRVLKWGGRMVCLDTTPLPGDAWHLPARIYVGYIIPMIGKVVAGDEGAYRYLPDSTARFLKAEDLAISLGRMGFRLVGFKRFMGGTVAMHWGVK